MLRNHRCACNHVAPILGAPYSDIFVKVLVRRVNYFQVGNWGCIVMHAGGLYSLRNQWDGKQNPYWATNF